MCIRGWPIVTMTVGSSSTHDQCDCATFGDIL
jgi:hypothetical protein